MAESLDMSLDEIIKKNKHQRGLSRVQKRRRTVLVDGPSRRRSFKTTTPYSLMPPQVVRIPEQEMIGGSEWNHGSTKLFVSNLDYGVTNDDIWLLFSDIGELKDYGLHFDKYGRSKGTAEVVFAHHADALAAIKRYNNMQLDGKPMTIEAVGVNVPTHPVPSTSYFAPKNPRGAFQRPGVAVYGRDHNSRRGHMTGQGGVTERSHRRPVSAKDLDADLDKYHSDAVQIK